jgi:hypothetical protein
MSARTPPSPTTRSTQRPSTGPSPLQHESELDEELSRCEVVNHDADVVQPLDGHVLDGKEVPERDEQRDAVDAFLNLKAS